MRNTRKTPRLAAGLLCAVASLLLLLCSIHLFSGDAGGAGAAPVLAAGLGLLAVAVQTLKPRHLD